MNIRFDKAKLKKFGIVFGSVVTSFYVLFLISPIVLSPIANSYCSQIQAMIKNSTGFDSKLNGVGVTTAPDLSVGLKVKEFSLSIPTSNEPFFKSDNFKVRLSLLPLLMKKVQLADIDAKNLYGNLVIKKDGSLLVEDYFPQNDNQNEPLTSLPFGLKLSNNLPNINVKGYKFVISDAIDSKNYYIQGKNFKISDFILDKKIKVKTSGKVVLDDDTVSNYDLNVYNKLMPNIQLDDLIFPKTVAVADTEDLQQENSTPKINIIDIFKAIKNNGLHADVIAKVKTFGTLNSPEIKGNLDVSAMTVAVNGNKLPESYANLKFKGNKTDIDSIFFSSTDENEKTQIIGSVQSGKKPSIDLTLRSNAKFNNVIKLVDSIAQSFGNNDFKTLSATGGIDADFNINSDMKKVSSTGYLKINPSSLKYGLYNIVIDKITADIDMMNNDINIKKAGFSILGHPLKLSGTIKSNSDTDLKLVADKLSVKGLLAALGQVSLLKENNVNGGTLSLNTSIKGKLSELKPVVKADINSLDILNKASNIKLLLSNAMIKLVCDKKSLTGDIDVNSLILKNPTASVSVPKTRIVMDSKDVTIKNSYLLINNSRVDLTGRVKDYLTKNLKMNIKAKGNIAASDIAAFIPQNMRSMFPYMGKLPVEIVAKGDSKVQDICFKMTANPTNYIKFADIDLLKNKTTKIHTDIKISGDTLSLTDSGLWAGGTSVATLEGGISKLYSNPKLNIIVSVPHSISFPIWGLNNSNITVKGDAAVVGDITNPQVKGSLNFADISSKDMNFALTDLNANLNGPILKGNATAKKFKFGGIIASDISSKFSLLNYTDFYLSDLSAKAFDGKINGKISYNIPNYMIGVDLTGAGLNSTDAVYGAVGIKNALTGTLGFNAKLSMQGVTDREIMNSMKGNVNFDVKNGRFVGIGRLENLVMAQNISSNSILKAAISSLSTLSTVQETDRFKEINGEMTLANGNATISSIKVAGPLMSYFVKGTYYILPNSATLTILGRLDSKVVSCLGVLGDLSADKLLSYIPKFGAMTSKILKQLTADPANENTALIPALSNGSTSYKDFKVIFNGPVESTSSVRNFKWLSTCDTTQMNVKKDLESAKDAVKSNINNKVENAKNTAQNVKSNVNKIVETQKNKVDTAKKEMEQTKADIQKAKENRAQSAENLKKMLNNAMKNSQNKVNSSAPASTTTTTPAAETVKEETTTKAE